LIVFLADFGYAEESTNQILIFPFEFSGLTAAQEKEFNIELGLILADEVQSEMYAMGGFSPVTMTNLKSQMKKAEMVELTKCMDNQCFQKITDNFGIDDNVFGTVKVMGSELHVTITWTYDDQVKKAVTGLSPMEPKALISKVHMLAGKLLGNAVEGTKTGSISVSAPGSWDPEMGMPLKIVSKPAEANLMIDGKEVGVTPHSGFKKPGTYAITITRPYYETKKATIKVKAGDPKSYQAFEFILSPNFGSLLITGVPKDAQVYIDDTLKGQGDVTVDKINPGPHIVVVKGDSYVDFSTTITVTKGETLPVTATPQYKQGYLQVMAKDHGGNGLEGTVELNGTPAGPLPFAGKVPVGLYKVTVSTPAGKKSKKVTVKHKKTIPVELIIGDVKVLAKNPSFSTGSPSALGTNKQGQSRWYSSTGGWITLGLGIVSASIGGGVLMAADDNYEELKGDMATSLSYNDAKLEMDSVELHDTVGITMLVAGGGLVVTSLILFGTYDGATSNGGQVGQSGGIELVPTVTMSAEQVFLGVMGSY